MLGTPAVHEWAALCRVDTLALGLSLAGIWLAERERGEILAAPVLAAAFFAKQVALAAPAAVVLSLWLRGERRRAGLFTVLYGALVGVSLAVLDWRSAGEVHRHLVPYAAFPGFGPGTLAGWLLRFGFAFPVLLPMGLSGRRDWARTPSGVWVLMALATLVMSGKPGAASNYLLEASAAVVLAGAIAAERRLGQVTGMARRDLSLLLVVQLLILCGPFRPLEIRALVAEKRVARQAVEALAAAPGPVLAEDLGLVLAAGKEPMLEPFQFWLLAKAGMFDPAPVLERIGHRDFGAVLVGSRLRNLPGLMQALEASYVRAGRIDPYELWVPRP